MVFIHVVDFPGYETIINDILEKIIVSGLINRSEIFFCCNNNAQSYNWLQEKCKSYSNVKFEFTELDPKEGEIPTLDKLKNYCDQLETEHYVLYLHTKGVSWIGKEPTYTYIQDWRNLMLYFTVERWQDCVTNLDQGFDTAGVNWNTEYQFHHYSGNFWWASSKYIKKLPKFVRPREIGFNSQFSFGHNDCRLDAEFWLGIKNPNYSCLHYSNVNHYHQRYLDSNYRVL